MKFRLLPPNAIFLLLLFKIGLCSHSVNLFTPSDASSLLAFKATADLGGKQLHFSPNTSFLFCRWQGVKCQQRRVVRLVLENLGLSGTFSPNTLSTLDQLRVLSLQNNWLTGPIPDLSGLLNLKALFLDRNRFTGSIPPSISSLHRLRTLDLSFNNLTGILPSKLNHLDRLYYLRLDSNQLSGSVPPLNQTTLQVLNVSRNNLSGAVPVTPTLLRFGVESFMLNPGLCGEIIHNECHSAPPFFGPSTAAAPPLISSIISQNAQLQQQGVELRGGPSPVKGKRTELIIGFSAAIFILFASIFCFAVAIKKQHGNKKKKVSTTSAMAADSAATEDAAAVMRIEEENELEEKVKRVQEGMQMEKSGSLVFCAGEVQLYTLEQLMRASAEMLGKGTIGTTYKAVLDNVDNRLMVCVKRLDARKLAGSWKSVDGHFEQHMEAVGGLRHPNLVPLRAYFQAREERLLVYDYQPNGSLFSLIHGSKSGRAKPLHWTSCLKIAEDVAQGLSYIHQAWRLVHGNLKSTNVLLGSDFEACLSDCCLSVLAEDDPSAALDNPDSLAYRAPETRSTTYNHHRKQATAKCDVYSFGILLLELLTGKLPSQHPHLMPSEMIHWVRSSREDDAGGGQDCRLEALLEIALACSVASSEQRPTMWQVLKMIQEIKETVTIVDGELELVHTR